MAAKVKESKKCCFCGTHVFCLLHFLHLAKNCNYGTVFFSMCFPPLSLPRLHSALPFSSPSWLFAHLISRERGGRQEGGGNGGEPVFPLRKRGTRRGGSSARVGIAPKRLSWSLQQDLLPPKCFPFHSAQLELSLCEKKR